MADEVKKEGACCGGGKEEACCAGGKKAASAIFKVVLGVVFLVLGIMALLRWLPALLTVIKGCIGLFLILAGIITLAIAKE